MRTDFSVLFVFFVSVQIDLGHERLVSGVASQGYVHGMFVSKYKIFYSTDGQHWQAYKKYKTNVTKYKTNDTKVRNGNRLYHIHMKTCDDVHLRT